MTVSSTTVKVQQNGNGSNDTFAYNYPFVATSHLVVTTTVVATGVDTTKTEGTHYDVTGTLVNGTYPNGGSVVFRAGHIPPTGTRVTITRNTSLTQETDYVENDSFPAETHEQVLDKLILIVQEQGLQLLRTVRLPVGTTLSGLLFEEPVDGSGIYYDSATGKLKWTEFNLVTGLDDAAEDAAAAASAAAATSATNAATSATNAANSASAAATSATAAQTAETNAETAETSAETAQAAAEAAQAAAEAAAATFTAASVAEVQTGTNTTKFVSPDTLASLWEKGADIASAGTITIPATGGAFFHITGTTTITALSQATVKTGRIVRLVFDGALTLTHNATSLILPGNANITTAAGDSAVFVCEDSGNNYWRCLSYTKKSGVAIVSGFPDATFTSAAQTFAAGTEVDIPHSQSGLPKFVDYYYKCINTSGAGNHAVGDYWYPALSSVSYSATGHGVSVHANATNLRLAYGTNLRITDKDSAANIVFATASSFEIYVRGWW